MQLAEWRCPKCLVFTAASSRISACRHAKTAAAHRRYRIRRCCSRECPRAPEFDPIRRNGCCRRGNGKSADQCQRRSHWLCTQNVTCCQSRGSHDPTAYPGGRVRQPYTVGRCEGTDPEMRIVPLHFAAKPRRARPLSGGDLTTHPMAVSPHAHPERQGHRLSAVAARRPPTVPARLAAKPLSHPPPYHRLQESTEQPRLSGWLADRST
jgi:hypothetical protein